MKKIEKAKGIKIKREDVMVWSHNLSQIDALGSVYPQKVSGRFTALDYYLQEFFPAGKKFYNTVRKEAIRTLKKTESDKDPTEDEIKEYVSNHAEYNEFLQEEVVIPVEPVKLADLEGGHFPPTIFRPFYGTFILL